MAGHVNDFGSGYFSFSYSALASFRMGMSGSASFQMAANLRGGEVLLRHARRSAGCFIQPANFRQVSGFSLLWIRLGEENDIGGLVLVGDRQCFTVGRPMKIAN